MKVSQTSLCFQFQYHILKQLKWIYVKWLKKVLNISLGIICVRTTAPEENCPPVNCRPDNFPRGKFPLRQLTSRESSWTITPVIIAPRQYPPVNCPRGKLSFRWFAVYIIPPRKTDPRNIIPRMNYTRYIFPQESEIVVL